METTVTFEEMVLGNQIALLNALAIICRDNETSSLLVQTAAITQEWLRQYESDRLATPIRQ